MRNIPSAASTLPVAESPLNHNQAPSATDDVDIHQEVEMVRNWILILAAANMVGCAAIGDFAVPPHHNSEAESPDAVCVTFIPAKKEEVAAALLLAPIAEAAAKFAIDQTAKAIEKESKRYSVTYSGRTSDELFTVAKVETTTNDAGKSVDRAVPGLQIGGLRVTRLYGKGVEKSGCAAPLLGDPKPENVMDFEAVLEVSAQKDAIRIVPTAFSMTKAKGKVAAPRPYVPWSWWMWLDSSRGKVDVDIQVDLSVIAMTKTGRSPVDLGKFDVPIGKLSLDQPVSKNLRQLQHLASGWIPLPDIQAPATVGATYGPVDLIVTVIEADDLGDVIAKGAAKLEDNKDKAVTGLLSALGLGSNDKTSTNDKTNGK